MGSTKWPSSLSKAIDLNRTTEAKVDAAWRRAHPHGTPRDPTGPHGTPRDPTGPHRTPQDPTPLLALPTSHPTGAPHLYPAGAYGALFRAGRFDPLSTVKWSELGLDHINSTHHQQVTHEAALQGLVLRHGSHPMGPHPHRTPPTHPMGPHHEEEVLRHGSYSVRSSHLHCRALFSLTIAALCIALPASH
jgi:hypothetical protein